MGSEVRTHSRDGVRVSRQSLQTLSCLNVPDSNTLIKLQKQKETGRFETSGTSAVWPSSGEAAYRSRHHQVGLGVEVTAEDIVTVTLQSLQTLPLQTQRNIRHQSVVTSVNSVLSRRLTRTNSVSPSCCPRSLAFCRQTQKPVGWSLTTRRHQRSPKTHRARIRTRSRLRSEPDPDSAAHQFVSNDGFLKLSIVCSPDFYQLVCSCKDMLPGLQWEPISSQSEEVTP